MSLPPIARSVWECGALGGIAGNEWKPRMLRRRQLCQPRENTGGGTAHLNSPFTRADLTRCRRSCCQPLKILTLQAVLFPTEADKGSPVCACIRMHVQARLPGCGASWRYHPCPFASRITALWQRVSTLWVRRAE